MSHVFDLTRDEGGTDLLSATEAEGLLGPDNLCTAPLASRLVDGETARYLVRNKKAGATIEEVDDRERSLEPDGNYQAFLVVTDRRLLFVAGQADGDATFTLPLADVLEVDVESAGLRSSRLVIETADGRRITFPCRGDLGEVAETIEADAAAWSHAERCYEDAEAALERAEGAIADGDHEAALGALEAARDAWEEALANAADVHQDAAAWLDGRIDGHRPTEVTLRRRATAQAGGSAHAAAQAAWAERDYERAADAYERAVAAYSEAAGVPGDEPSGESLRQRIAAAARERSVLRVGPLIDAHDARESATATDDVEGAPAAWEAALERYRAALELEWGEGGREFAIDREAVREHTAAAAEAAIDARIEVATRWVTAGDALAATQEGADAGRLYDRAERHLESARELAVEVQPERREGIEAELDAVEDRRAGRIEPESEPPSGPMPVDSVAEALDVLGDDVDLSGESPSVPDPDEAAGVPDPDEAAGAPAPVANAASGAPSEEEPAPVDATAADDAADRAEATGPDSSPDDSTGARRIEGLRDLDDRAFEDLVAAVWTGRGWSTAAFETDVGTVYDLLAVRDGERLLLWTVRCPDGEPVDTAVIERCATTRDRSKGADGAAVVADGSFGSAAAERAADLDVETVDGEALLELIEEAEIGDRL